MCGESLVGKNLKSDGTLTAFAGPNLLEPWTELGGDGEGGAGWGR